MRYTRTINPLHFEDLEPHRFEDLVRQLIYDFKDWKSIEATGKLGADEGVDIMAIETVIGDLVNDEEQTYDSADRKWVIQCKREKTITPKKITEILRNDIGKHEEKPYGYILVASTDFSKKTRDIFRKTLNEYGINEFYLYGKSELEDLLFLPKYDHLLFAYFGLSLQKRKKTLKTNLSSRLSTKRKLIKTIGGLNDITEGVLLVRPAEQSGYPRITNKKNLLWRFYEVAFYQPHDSISLITKKYFAYIDWDTKQWDIIDDCDIGFPNSPELFDLTQEYYNQLNQNYHIALNKWNTLDENNKGYFIEVRPIHFDRILIIDEIGDSYNEAPHLIVDYIDNSPFDNRIISYIEPNNMHSDEIFREPKMKNRITIFK